MIRHRFINDGVSPIPMGPTARYACVCGKTGTREAIARHIAESSADSEPQRARDDAAKVVDDYSGGDTKVNYLPSAPRKPAPTKESAPLPRPDRPERAMSPQPLPPAPSAPKIVVCSLCGTGAPLCDLPEITAWSCGHWIRKDPRSIAESFQDMLRVSYQAGVVSATTGETFETWYERKVLR